MRRGRGAFGGVRIARAAVATLAVGAFAAASPTQDGPPGSGRAYEAAIEQLVREAEEAKRAMMLPATRPDFASRFPHELSEADVVRGICRRGHRDPFVDAYVRWQLTSFDPPLPKLVEEDDEAFLQLMNEAPPLVENPAAHPPTIALFERAGEAGPLPPAHAENARRAWAALQERGRLVEEMNRPAMEWRAWIAEKFGVTGARPRQWMAEELATSIAGGWPVTSIKSRMSREYSRSAPDASFTGPQREWLVRQISTLLGRERRYVREVTFFANGDLEVTIGTAGIDEDDLANWRDRLAGRKDP